MPTDTSDQPAALNTPVVAGGLERIPFFNGRVLTAEDLQTEQAANAAERRRLGRAYGSGVVDGLFVRKQTDQTVRVEAGTAVAPNGGVVHLPQTTEVSVVSAIENDRTGGTGGAFEDCETQTVTVTSGTGAYVLALCPASKPDGRVPRTSLGGDGAASACGAERRLEGAKLTLVPLDTRDPDLVPSSIDEAVEDQIDAVDAALDDGNAPAPSTRSTLRNLLAHACLRTPQTETASADLYTALRDAARGETREASPRPVLDAVGDYAGTGAVPLGMLYWAQDRLLFVDAWSVRRRVHRRDPQRPQPATARRRAEAEAAIFQFQDHVADLVSDLGVVQRSQVRASDYFAFLPPIGTVPSDRSDRKGLYPPTFFSGLTARDPLFLEGAKLRGLMATAPEFDAFRIQSDVLIWRYHVREDVQSSDADQPSYLVFASGFVPFAAEPQYNLSRWNYANYGPGIALR